MSRTPPPSGGSRGRPDRVLGEGGLMPLLKEWWDELLWPRVLWGAKYGLRPGRLGLAFFLVVVSTLLVGVGTALDERWRGAVAWPWLSGEHRGFWSMLWVWFVETPWVWAWARPLTTIVIGPLLLVAWAVGLGAISRMSASEISHDESVPWPAGLGFALARWRSLVGAVLGPLALAWLLAGMLVLGGLLARWPVANLVFAIGYGVALVVGLLATLVLAVFLLGRGMLIPAVVCEGTDAIDAIQKAYRYVLGRPLRLVCYLVLGIAGWTVVVGVVWVIASCAIGFAAHATGVWSGDGRDMIWSATLEAAQGLGFWGGAVKPTGTFAAAETIVRLWVLIPVLLVFAAAISCGMATHTMVYLAMRRACDGQDVAELWVPGMIAGTMAVAMEGRGRAAATMAEGAAAPPPRPEEADYE